jgi:hypothetical protein
LYDLHKKLAQFLAKNRRKQSIMKLFIKLLLVILVLGMAGPFFLKRPDGRPWMEPADVMPKISQWQHEAGRFWRDTKSWFSGLTDSDVLSRIEGGDYQAGQTKVYRWRDANGTWQLSDQPPATGEADIIMVDPDTNLIQGLPEEPEEPENVEQAPAQSPSVGLPLPMTVPLDQVSKLQEDALKVQEQLNRRNEALEEALNRADK